MKRSEEESKEKYQPLQYCIQSQEEEASIEEMNVVNQRTGGPNPEVIMVLTNRSRSNVGIVERSGTTKISAEVHERLMRPTTRQMLLPPLEEIMR